MRKTFILSLAVFGLCFSNLFCQDGEKLTKFIETLQNSENPAIKPRARSERWIKNTEKQNTIMQKQQVDVLLIGDSITAGWKKHPNKLKIAFESKKVLNLGHPADKTENMIWRMIRYDMSKVKPRIAVIMAGTNNSNDKGSKLGYYSNEDIIAGVKALTSLTKLKLPETKIILMGILPRGSYEQRKAVKKGLTEAAMNPQWARIQKINLELKKFANEIDARYMDIGDIFLNDKGALVTTAMPDLLHPNAQGYDIWANAMKPYIASLEKRHSSKDKKAFYEQDKNIWKSTFYDSFTKDWTEQWTLDGEVGTVETSEKGTLLTSGPEFRNNAHHMVLWTKREFQGDVKIEYEFTRIDNEPRCVNILYIQATGIGKEPHHKDISKWAHLRKEPAMNLYFDYMNTYHISYAAFPNSNNEKEDYIRARRYMPHKKGLDGTDLLPDYFMNGFFETGVPHKFCVIKKDRDIYMKITSPTHSKYFHWLNKDLPEITEGRIGLRLMFCRSSLFKNFRVSVPES